MAKGDAIRALIAGLGAGAGDLGRSLQSRKTEQRAEKRALDRLKQQQTASTEKIERTIIDPKDGSVWNVYADGSAARAKIRPGSETPPAPDVQGAAPEDAPEPSGLKLGVKLPTPKVTPAKTPPRRLIRAKSNKIVSVDPETGLDAEGNPVEAYQPPAQTPANTGAATIRQKVAENRSMESQIEKAMEATKAYPKAFSMVRGIPVVGDRLDARLDPDGVAARSLVANIGSLKVHQRSGGAVSVSEFPRLAPFVPQIYDPPEKILTNLQQLLEEVRKYNLELEGPDADEAPVVSRAGAKPPLADRVRQLKAEGLSKEQAKAKLRAEGYEVP